MQNNYSQLHQILSTQAVRFIIIATKEHCYGAKCCALIIQKTNLIYNLIQCKTVETRIFNSYKQLKSRTTHTETEDFFMLGRMFKQHTKGKFLKCFFVSDAAAKDNH